MGFLQDEIHALFSCSAYANVKQFEGKIKFPRALEEILLELILRENLQSDNIKAMGEFLECLWEERRNALYKVI